MRFLDRRHAVRTASRSVLAEWNFTGESFQCCGMIRWICLFFFSVPALINNLIGSSIQGDQTCWTWPAPVAARGVQTPYLIDSFATHYAALWSPFQSLETSTPDSLWPLDYLSKNMLFSCSPTFALSLYVLTKYMLMSLLTSC